MATLHPHALRIRTAGRIDEARIRRWCMLAIVAAVLLAAYAGGLAWATRTVEAGVDRSLQPLPELVREQPSA
jgi:hypothetical protein